MQSLILQCCHGGRRERERIERLDAEEQSSERAGTKPGDHEAGNDAEATEHGGFAHEQARQVQTIRAVQPGRSYRAIDTLMATTCVSVFSPAFAVTSIR